MGAVFLTIYLPDLGHGFISDDFRWINESRVDAPADIAGIFTTNIGFYRPLVALSFASDSSLWGTNAFGYGLTNLLLCSASALLLFALARCLALPVAASLLAVGVWVFNFHAVNMALLWISGRTSLLVSVFSLATAIFFLQRRVLLAGAACLAAMLSKEEAVLLPVLFTGFDSWTSRSMAVRRAWPLWAALAVYLVLRLPSGAFWPTDAPEYYAFTLSPAVLGRNLLEYADRSATVAAAVSLTLLGFTRPGWRDLGEPERKGLLLAACWVPATFALTLLVPVRSSLYALLPSLGTALAAAVAASVALRSNSRVFNRVAMALLVLAMLLIPVYRSRNVRWVSLADLTTNVLRTLEDVTNGRPSGHIVLVDNPDERVNLSSGFGSLFPDAVRLYLREGWTGEIVTPPDEPRGPGDMTFILSNGTLVPR
jgi:hypothetical protein